MTEQNQQQQDDADSGRDPSRLQQPRGPGRKDGAPRRGGQAAREVDSRGRDQVRDDPAEPHDESRLG